MPVHYVAPWRFIIVQLEKSVVFLVLHISFVLIATPFYEKFLIPICTNARTNENRTGTNWTSKEGLQKASYIVRTPGEDSYAAMLAMAMGSTLNSPSVDCCGQ